MGALLRGFRNAVRTPSRTVAIVLVLSLGFALALSMYASMRAVDDRIATVRENVGDALTISAAGQRGFDDGAGLSESGLASVRSVPHVTDLTDGLIVQIRSANTTLRAAVPSGFGRGGPGGGQGGGGQFQGGGRGGRGNFTPALRGLGLDALRDLTAFGGGTLTIKQGSLFDAKSTADVALLGVDLAKRNSLAAGSTFQAYGHMVTVTGIFDAGNNFANSTLVIFPLHTLQAYANQADAVSTALVRVDDAAHVTQVQTSVTALLADSADVTNQAAAAEAAVAPLKSISSLSTLSLVGALVAAVAIDFLMTLLIVRERRREIAVLKTLGGPNRSIIAQFVAEAFALTGLAAIAGTVLGIAVSGPLLRTLVSGSSPTGGNGGFGGGAGGGGFLANQALRGLTAVIGWDLLLVAVLAAVLVAGLGSALASWSIAKVRPADVLRGD